MITLARATINGCGRLNIRDAKKAITAMGGEYTGDSFVEARKACRKLCLRIIAAAPAVPKPAPAPAPVVEELDEDDEDNASVASTASSSSSEEEEDDDTASTASSSSSEDEDDEDNASVASSASSSSSEDEEEAEAVVENNDHLAIVPYIAPVEMITIPKSEYDALIALRDGKKVAPKVVRKATKASAPTDKFVPREGVQYKYPIKPVEVGEGVRKPASDDAKVNARRAYQRERYRQIYAAKYAADRLAKKQKDDALLAPADNE